MRVTREQAAANRERILDAAGTLFREHGFERIGVDEIMKRAGLTHGGFYNHFASKDELVAEITARIGRREGWMQRLTGNASPSLTDLIRAYLSPRHRDDPGHGCLLSSLGSDVGRQPHSVRDAFTDGLQLRLERLATMVRGRTAAVRRRKAMATMAAIVGALTLSRAVDDPRLSDEILDAVAASIVRP